MGETEWKILLRSYESNNGKLLAYDYYSSVVQFLAGKEDIKKESTLSILLLTLNLNELKFRKAYVLSSRFLVQLYIDNLRDDCPDRVSLDRQLLQITSTFKDHGDYVPISPTPKKGFAIQLRL